MKPFPCHVSGMEGRTERLQNDAFFGGAMRNLSSPSSTVARCAVESRLHSWTPGERVRADRTCERVQERGLGDALESLTPSPSPARGRGETRTTRQGVPMQQKLCSLIYSVILSAPKRARGRGETRTTRQGIPMQQKLCSLIFSVRP